MVHSCVEPTLPRASAGHGVCLGIGGGSVRHDPCTRTERSHERGDVDAARARGLTSTSFHPPIDLGTNDRYGHVVVDTVEQDQVECVSGPRAYIERGRLVIQGLLPPPTTLCGDALVGRASVSSHKRGSNGLVVGSCQARSPGSLCSCGRD